MDRDISASTAIEVFNGIQNMRVMILNRKPKIKKYYAIRGIYTEVVDSMTTFYQNGNYKLDKYLDKIYINNKDLYIFNNIIKPDSEEDSRFFEEIICFSNYNGKQNITDLFIRKKVFKSQEKIDMLKAMKQSNIGLFEIIDSELFEGYVIIKDIITNKKHKIIDVALSGNMVNNKSYLYTRIANYNGMSFNIGPSFFLKKDSLLVKKLIKKEKNNKTFDFILTNKVYEIYKKDGLQGNIKNIKKGVGIRYE